MPTMTVAIKLIDPPTAAKKRGVLHGTNGERLGVFAEKAKLFEPGKTYDVDYEEVPYQDRTLRNVKSAVEVYGKPEAASASPAAPASGGSGYYRPTSPEDAERMFVCATLGALIKAGEVKYDKRQLWEATNTLRGLWGATFGDANTFTPSEAGRVARR